MMRLDEVKELREAAVEEANQALKENFTLMKVLKVKEKDDESIRYVLAK